MTRSSFPRPVRWARVLAAVALASSGAVAAFATMGPSPDAELLASKAPVVESFHIDLARALVAQPERFTRQDRLLRGDTHAGLLGRLGVREGDISTLLRSGTLRKLRPPTTVTAEVNGEGALLDLSFLDASALSRIVPSESGFSLRAEKALLETRSAFRSTTVSSSLFAAADAADIPDAVALQLADIFAGDIDFHRDLRKGDRFSVIYEVHYLNGQLVRTGRVLAAEFVNQGRAYRALEYSGADGKFAYYSPEGKSLRKAFLRSPLEFSRISSGFGSRLHPFLQTWRSHKGVDYAAPAGTRIRAVADGSVEFVGGKGGYGNVVVLRHQGQYSTVYAHMSRFAQGLKPGLRVAQGDLIGFVGQSGWATGPHLHYEFHIAGQARNPLTIALPVALPIAPRELNAYLGHVQPLLAHLGLLGATRLAQAD